MIKALIIDDEISVREAIKILGNWKELSIDEILEAENGKLAKKIVREQNPDIVLVDMRMPEMNGIEFLKSISETNPETVSIVVSGYDDFEYTKEAIRYKASDYLLKPVDRTALNDALKSAVEAVMANRQNKLKQIERSIKMDISLASLKERIYISAIDGNFNEQIRSTYLKMIKSDEKNKNYGIILLSFLNICKICKESFDNDFDTIYIALNNVTAEICKPYFDQFCFKNNKNDREIIIVAEFDTSVSNEKIELNTLEASKRVIRKLKELFNISTAVGIGTFASNLKELSQSYLRANAAVNNIDLLGSKRIETSINQKKAKTNGASILLKMPQLRKAFDGGSLELISNVVSDYLREIKESGSLTLQEANKAVSELIFVLNDITLEFDSEAIESTHDIEGVLREAEINFDYLSFDEFSKLLLDITAYFYNQVRKKVKIYHQFDTREIKEYIDKNYFQEIKISMFTEKYFLSKAYIMKLFKKNYSMSIYEYVQKIRMDKATELLRDPKINIQNISEMVGYSNNNYFSKAFKNYFHISPSNYRLMIFERDKTKVDEQLQTTSV